MKLILFLILFVSGLLASSLEFIKEMKYETNYDVALKKAKESKKILMMVATTQSCPWCRKLERQTLSKEDINSLIQEKFVPVSVDQDLKNFPQKFEVKVVPTVYFINVNDETVIEKSLGYKNKKDFEVILKEVISK